MVRPGTGSHKNACNSILARLRDEVKAVLETRLNLVSFIFYKFPCKIKGKIANMHLKERHFLMCDQPSFSPSICSQRKGEMQ